jgi:hypothetical protein
MHYGPWHVAVVQTGLTTVITHAWRRWVFDEHGEIVAVQWMR